jgi:hypothetical protein
MTPGLASLPQGRRQDRATVKSIGPFAGFDLEMLSGNLVTLSLGEANYGGPLSLDPKAALALLLRADPVVGDGLHVLFPSDMQRSTKP